MGAPYRRKYHHTKSKGQETSVRCEFCGKIVPKWKTFTSYKSFGINDPVLRKQIDPRFVSSFTRKTYACPSCARHRHIIKPGRSRKSRTSNL